MKTYYSKSYKETFNIASEFAKTLPKGAVVAFIGDLGAGKTMFTSGIVKGLGIDAEVSSPTFAICNEYSGNGKTLYHFDMYRIETWADLYSTAFFDYLDTGAYMCIEWSENIFSALPNDAIIVEIEKLSENERNIMIYKREEMHEC